MLWWYIYLSGFSFHNCLDFVLYFIWNKNGKRKSYCYYRVNRPCFSQVYQKVSVHFDETFIKVGKRKYRVGVKILQLGDELPTKSRKKTDPKLPGHLLTLLPIDIKGQLVPYLSSSLMPLPPLTIYLVRLNGSLK